MQMTLSVLFVCIVTMLMQNLLIVMFLVVIMLNQHMKFLIVFFVQQLHHCSVDPHVVD